MKGMKTRHSLDPAEVAYRWEKDVKWEEGMETMYIKKT